jgi:hypothetical protein
MLVQLLRGYNNKHPKTWDEQLIYIQHSYNRAIHSSTNKSPFQTCFGYLPPSKFDIVYGKWKEEEKLQGEEKKESTFVDKIEHIHLSVQEKLKKSKTLYKSRHDQHWENHKLCVGDQVWLYTCRESLQGASKKIKPLRYGPFEIMDKVNENTFRMKLPSHMYSDQW